MTSTAIDQTSVLVSSMLLVPTFDEHGVPATVPHEPEAARSDVPTKPALTTEQGMMRAVKMGALVGIPGEFVVTGGMALLAGATPLISLAIGVFCSLWGGAYMGAIFFLPRTEEHFVRPLEWETVASFNAKAAAAAVAPSAWSTPAPQPAAMFHQMLSRVEIAEHIETAFDGSRRLRDDLVAEATRTSARSAVLDALGGLPDRPYRKLGDVWPHLPTMPIDLSDG